MKNGVSVVNASADELRRMYWDNEDVSIQDIADKLGCSREIVRRKFKKYGIPIKQRGSMSSKKMINPKLKDKEWLAEEIKTKPDKVIAEELGVQPQVVSYWVKTHGIRVLGDKSEAVKASLKKAFPEGRFGEKAGKWKGGRSVTKQGYIKIHAPDHPNASSGRVFEHRLVMEKKLGRYLESHEIVHHIDGNKSNNDPDNLELTVVGTHTSDHFKASHEVTKLRKDLAEAKKYIEELERRIAEMQSSK
jgi:biotin operon repressor